MEVYNENSRLRIRKWDTYTGFSLAEVFRWKRKEELGDFLKIAKSTKYRPILIKLQWDSGRSLQGGYVKVSYDVLLFCHRNPGKQERVPFSGISSEGNVWASLRTMLSDCQTKWFQMRSATCFLVCFEFSKQKLVQLMQHVPYPSRTW